MAFEGRGQIRLRWQEGDHADLGCLTETGKWTGNDEACGVFVATPAGNELFNLGSSSGDCYVYGATFLCDGGQEAFQFGVWPAYWPNGIPDVPVLRWGQFGVMASNERTAPGVADAPQTLHLTSYTEPGKKVWLTWKKLE
ncbi:hypothetical protein QBC34DRAFT_304346 [Podospora aff. communis PSN243]|uniref:RNase T2-like C-terminal domain-containing protein n=1 Tax=Podospora aff. communis PSN243 TaxID=3040156 RepID=A0AAV9GFZ6_9PEZI|nr:hypothetical protein QBC34DRAFT_304346 [Podospora aff. communis PSN243]